MHRTGRPGVHPAKAQFLGGFSKQQLRTVTRLGTRFEREPGTVFIREGHAGAEFIIILDVNAVFSAEELALVRDTAEPVSEALAD